MAGKSKIKPVQVKNLELKKIRDFNSKKFEYLNRFIRASVSQIPFVFSKIGNNLLSNDEQKFAPRTLIAKS